MNARIARALRVVAAVLDGAAAVANFGSTVARCYAGEFERMDKLAEVYAGWEAAKRDIPRHDRDFEARYGEAA